MPLQRKQTALIRLFPGFVKGGNGSQVRQPEISLYVLRSLDRAVADTTRLIDGIEPRVARASETAVRLQEARARLQESIATAAVLFAALGEARALVQRVSAFVPR